MGTLYRYTYGKEPEKIASDVVCDTIDDGLIGYGMNLSSFTYMKMISHKSVDWLCDWCYYDGKSSRTMATNIKYGYYY